MGLSVLGTLIYVCAYLLVCMVFFVKQKTAYELRISDWSSDVCSSDLSVTGVGGTSFGPRGATLRFKSPPVRRAIREIIFFVWATALVRSHSVFLSAWLKTL